MLLSPKKGTMGQLTKLLAQAAITTLATKTVEMSAEFLGRWQRWEPRTLNKEKPFRGALALFFYIEKLVSIF